jgi:uncharacterized protein involved in exopolysaccharide biosynthesis
MKISESASGSDNATVAELRKRKNILEREFQKLRGEFSEDYLPSKQSIYVNSDWAVEKLIEQEKMERDLRRFLGTAEMLEGSIVMEQGNVARNIPVIQVVQDAYLADYKSGPKRAKWALGAAILASAFVFLLLFLYGIYSGGFPCEENTRESLKKLLRTLLKW